MCKGTVGGFMGLLFGKSMLQSNVKFKCSKLHSSEAARRTARAGNKSPEALVHHIFDLEYQNMFRITFKSIKPSF